MGECKWCFERVVNPGLCPLLPWGCYSLAPHNLLHPQLFAPRPPFLPTLYPPHLHPSPLVNPLPPLFPGFSNCLDQVEVVKGAPNGEKQNLIWSASVIHTDYHWSLLSVYYIQNKRSLLYCYSIPSNPLEKLMLHSSQRDFNARNAKEWATFWTSAHCRLSIPNPPLFMAGSHCSSHNLLRRVAARSMVYGEEWGHLQR